MIPKVHTAKGTVHRNVRTRHEVCTQEPNYRRWGIWNPTTQMHFGTNAWMKTVVQGRRSTHKTPRIGQCIATIVGRLGRPRSGVSCSGKAVTTLPVVSSYRSARNNKVTVKAREEDKANLESRKDEPTFGEIQPRRIFKWWVVLLVHQNISPWRTTRLRTSWT
jgi:hypothetical protein